MPALLPPPMPRFSCSTTVTSGNRSRTKATVPSLEPLSTTTVSCPRTDSRHRSSHGSALNVTTTTEASPIGHGRPPHALPHEHGEPRQREHDRHHEEEEAARERAVGVDVDLAEEADEERLAHREAV